MPFVTPLSERSAEHAIIERLFRASLDVHSALSLVSEERIACSLRQVIDHLDHSIKQVQGRALDLGLHLHGPEPCPRSARPHAAEPEGSAPAAAR